MENNNRPKQANFYKNTDILTANKETLLLMMYRGAIRFLKKAIEANDNGNAIERSRFISKTQQIVSELRATLNFEVGGDIAKNLDNLYLFVTDRLMQGNIQKNSELLQEALEILQTLNVAWETAVENLKKQQSEKV